MSNATSQLRTSRLAATVLGWWLVLAALFAVPAEADQSANEFAEVLAGLATTNFKTKEQAVERLSQLDHPSVEAILTALLEDALYFRKIDKQVFIIASQGESLTLTDAISGEAAGTAAPADFTRITTNNRLRTSLKGTLANFNLNSRDAGVRLAAVNDMLRTLDSSSLTLLKTRYDIESDRKVKDALEVALAMGELDDADPALRIAAIKQLRGHMHPEVFNRLSAIANDASELSADEQAVRAAALEAVNHVRSMRSFYGLLETLFFGLSLGSVLVLCAIGLAITFGVMGVINMAHGELMMLGAYTTYVIQQALPDAIGASVLIAIPTAFLVSGAVGVLIERGVVRFLYGRPLETLLATFGISLVLQQVVRDVFTANNRPVETPQWMAGSLQINEAFSLTYNRLYVIAFMLIVFALLQLVLRRTSLGLKVRAVAQNRAMARCMGVRTEWVDAITFGLGAGIAGVAGVALSQLTNVGPNLGQQYIIDSFMVVVFGGVGNLWGTLVGGMSLGLVNQFLQPFAGAVLAKVLVLIALILFIQRKPRGLFPQKGRAAEA